jgi:hypothetical protein
MTNRQMMTYGYVLSAAILMLALFWHTPYMQFGFLHLSLTAFAISTGFMLLRTKGKERVVDCVFVAVLIWSSITQWFYPVLYSDRNLYSALPLNICNIVTLLIMARPLYTKYIKVSKARMLDNYILCFGFLGAVTFFVIGLEFSSPGDPIGFFRLRTLESNIMHSFYLTYSIYMLLSGRIVPDKRAAIANIFWIIPLLCVFVFTNQIWRFNFFFTSIYENPLLPIYQMLPSFEVVIGGMVFDINLIYYTLILAGAMMCLYVVAVTFASVNRRLGVQTQALRSEMLITNNSDKRQI